MGQGSLRSQTCQITSKNRSCFPLVSVRKMALRKLSKNSCIPFKEMHLRLLLVCTCALVLVCVYVFVSLVGWLAGQL